MSTPDRLKLNVETILDDLCASEINASISWVWNGGIVVELGDPLNGYEAEGKVSTFSEAALWLPARRAPARCTRSPNTSRGTRALRDSTRHSNTSETRQKCVDLAVAFDRILTKF
jgi:hypothetical protein